MTVVSSRGCLAVRASVDRGTGALRARRVPYRGPIAGGAHLEPVVVDFLCRVGGRSRDECRLGDLGNGLDKADHLPDDHSHHQNPSVCQRRQRGDIASRSAVRPSGQCRGWPVTGYRCGRPACGLPLAAGGKSRLPRLVRAAPAHCPALEIPPRRRLVPEECSDGRRKSSDAFRTNQSRRSADTAKEACERPRGARVPLTPQPTRWNSIEENAAGG
jgi:hypothetical protein